MTGSPNTDISRKEDRMREFFYQPPGADYCLLVEADNLDEAWARAIALHGAGGLLTPVSRMNVP
jgi:hypothetical protein